MKEGIRDIVVYAEDSDNVRGMVSEALKEQGYIVIASCNGNEAILEYMTLEGNNEPHRRIILTDYRMPIIDGLGLVKTISSYERGRFKSRITPIILHSAEARIPHELRREVDAIITKEGNLEQLVSQVRESFSVFNIRATAAGFYERWK